MYRSRASRSLRVIALAGGVACSLACRGAVFPEEEPELASTEGESEPERGAEAVPRSRRAAAETLAPLQDYAVEVRALFTSANGETDMHLRRALRLLAAAIERAPLAQDEPLVPVAVDQIRASERRLTMSLPMEIEYANGAYSALDAAAAVLRSLAKRAYRESPRVIQHIEELERVSAQLRKARATTLDRARVLATLEQAGLVLEAMYDAAGVREPR